MIVTRDDIILSSLRTLGILGLTQQPVGSLMTNASLALNMMIKQWMAKGVTLWKIGEVVVTMAASTRSYLLGPTTETTRPLRVLDQGNFIRNISAQFDVPITLLGRDDYMIYGNKFTPGIPNSIWYDPQLGDGVLYVYPCPVDNSREVHLMCQLPYDDIAQAADSPNFPEEWFSPLKWGLAREYLTEAGVDERTEARVEARYKEFVTDGLNFSVDEASTYFTYDNRSR